MQEDSIFQDGFFQQQVCLDLVAHGTGTCIRWPCIYHTSPLFKIRCVHVTIVPCRHMGNGFFSLPCSLLTSASIVLRQKFSNCALWIVGWSYNTCLTLFPAAKLHFKKDKCLSFDVSNYFIIVWISCGPIQPLLKYGWHWKCRISGLIVSKISYVEKHRYKN